MEEFELKEIMSGGDEYCLWVTLWFSSDQKNLDVLHVVCGKSIGAQDRATGMDGIYLERFDQAYSEYKGADSIKVSVLGIEVDLNANGQKALNFEGSVEFLYPEELVGLSDALAVFSAMAECESGKVIEVTHQAALRGLS